MEDRKIVELFWNRSEYAIAELAGKYGGLCRSLANRILRDSRDVEECVNDAYLAVWQRIPPERPSPLSAYICGITKNLALKKYHTLAAQAGRIRKFWLFFYYIHRPAALQPILKNNSRKTI